MPGLDPLVDPTETVRLEAGQVTAYVEARINALADRVRIVPPPPTDEISSQTYLRWERRLLVDYGRIIGALEALVTFKLLPEQVRKASAQRLMMIMSGRVAAVQWDGG